MSVFGIGCVVSKESNSFYFGVKYFVAAATTGTRPALTQREENICTGAHMTRTFAVSII